MLLSIFADIFDDGWEEKRKYCVYKAGTILKALKAGQQPPRGNPNDPENDGLRKTPEELKGKKEEPKEEEKQPDNGPNMDDLDAMMAGLENMGNVQPTNPPPMPDLDFGLPDNSNPGAS
jgi:hypothetical protein